MRLHINGEHYEVNAEPERTLLDVLREDLRLTGTKRGCDIGICGTCTVLIDGKPKRSCVVKIGSLVSPITNHQSLITTIEGLSKNGKLHPIQQAFIDCGAIQCGFCTPGMVLTAKALLDRNPDPTREEIRKAFAANLCRCTGYQQIVDAVEQAARSIRSSSKRSPS